VQRYVRCATERSELYRLLFWLACVSPKSDGVPESVTKVLDAWSALLIKRGIAEHLWTLLHGLIMLGLDQQSILDRVLGDGTTPSANPDANPGSNNGEVAPTSQGSTGKAFVQPAQRLTDETIDLSQVEIVQTPETKWVEVVEAEDITGPTMETVTGPDAAAPSIPPAASDGETAGDGHEDMTLL